MELNEIIINYLKTNLNHKRFVHSISVSKVACELARIYGCDENKAYIAGLAHDCAKEKDKKELIMLIEAEGFALDDITMREKELMHGPAAVSICRNIFNINDQDILNAVRYHTTGRAEMSILEKIIFIADFIEPGRSFPGVEILRSTAFENIEKAIVLACDSTIKYVMDKKALIHPDTVQARNSSMILLCRE